jgi:hypothetical protein
VNGRLGGDDLLVLAQEHGRARLALAAREKAQVLPEVVVADDVHGAADHRALHARREAALVALQLDPRSSGSGRPRRMSSSHTTAPPRPFPFAHHRFVGIAGPQTALSRPVAIGEPATIDAGAVTVPVTAPPVAPASG